ncbi:MAG: hypothetical protein RR905_02825, partial [Aurantimicrobium sp.]
EDLGNPHVGFGPRKAILRLKQAYRYEKSYDALWESDFYDLVSALWQQGYEARQAEEEAEYQQIAFGSEREPFPEVLKIPNPYGRGERELS